MKGCFGIACVALVVLVLGGCCVSCVTGVPIEYGSGERTGVVYKVSKKGMIWKTWEGEMNLGGMVKTGDGMSVNTWAFSVVDTEIVKKLQEVSESGEIVTLKYYQPWVLSCTEGGTDYKIIEIKKPEVKKKKKKPVVKVEEEEGE